MIDLNKELFRRLAPERKLELVKQALDSECLRVTEESLIRMVKEVGKGRSKDIKSHNKDFYIGGNVGNDWNSSIDSLSYYKKVLYIDLYIQYSNTDTTISDKMSNFLMSGNYTTHYTYEDRYGNKQTSYISYSVEDKAKVLRAICKAYIKARYGSKLKEKSNEA